MSTLLPKRGSVLLQTGIIYEVQLFPCILFVTTNVIAEQSSTETFDVPIPIVFTANNHAQLTELFLRVSADVDSAIKKDPFAPVKR